MTNDLRESLHDLVAEVPGHVVPPDLAARASRAGHRRRTRRRMAIAGLAVVVLAWLGYGVLPIASELGSVGPAGSNGTRGVGGYPARIGHQWWIRTLPSQPGPLAGFMQIVHHDPTNGDLPGGWVGLSQFGHQWWIPTPPADDFFPALSSDGRRLGYLAGQNGPYVIRDLVSGESVEFDDVGSNMEGGTTKYMTYDQAPAFWSPDGSRLVIHGSLRHPWVGRALVLGADGSKHLLRGEAWNPAGWVGNDRLAWLGWKPSGHGTNRHVTVRITTAEGSALRTVYLDMPFSGRTFLGQWSGVVSPGGEEIAVEVEHGSGIIVRRFSLADGSLVARPVQVADAATTCGLSWTERTPVVPTYSDAYTERQAVAVLATENPRSLVVADGSLGSPTCIMWASDAIGGDPHGSPFGLATEWWTWWWRELTLGGLFVVAGALGVVNVLRRRASSAHQA